MLLTYSEGRKLSKSRAIGNFVDFLVSDDIATNFALFWKNIFFIIFECGKPKLFHAFGLTKWCTCGRGSSVSGTLSQCVRSRGTRVG